MDVDTKQNTGDIMTNQNETKKSINDLTEEERRLATMRMTYAHDFERTKTEMLLDIHSLLETLTWAKENVENDRYYESDFDVDRMRKLEKDASGMTIYQNVLKNLAKVTPSLDEYLG